MFFWYIAVKLRKELYYYCFCYRRSGDPKWSQAPGIVQYKIEVGLCPEEFASLIAHKDEVMIQELYRGLMAGRRLEYSCVDKSSSHVAFL